MASAPSAPTVNNTNAGLKIPTFNTSSFRMPPMTSDGINRPVHLPLSSSTTMLANGLVSSNTATTKIAVGGKVIDVDVLTKLHQANNNGNVITFNASKDLLSNLAVKKLVGTKTIGQIKQNAVDNKVKLLTSKQQQSVGKTISVTVFSTQGKKNQEKFLLPKTNQPLIEIKKFAPEMNGLLTALKTSSSATTKKPIVAQSVDDKHVMKGYTLQNKPIRAPFIVNNSNKKDQQKKPLMLFQPSTTAVRSQYAPSKSNMLQTNNNAYRNQATVTTTTSRPNIQQQRIRNTNNNNNIKTTAFNNKMNVITSLSTKPSATSKPISAIVENRVYKANKVMLENNKKANFKIKDLLLKDLFSKKSSNDKDYTRIDG